jgi:hypothetical protein
LLRRQAEDERREWIRCAEFGIIVGVLTILAIGAGTSDESKDTKLHLFSAVILAKLVFAIMIDTQTGKA